MPAHMFYYYWRVALAPTLWGEKDNEIKNIDLCKILQNIHYLCPGLNNYLKVARNWLDCAALAGSFFLTNTSTMDRGGSAWPPPRLFFYVNAKKQEPATGSAGHGQARAQPSGTQCVFTCKQLIHNAMRKDLFSPSPFSCEIGGKHVPSIILKNFLCFFNQAGWPPYAKAPRFSLFLWIHKSTIYFSI